MVRRSLLFWDDRGFAMRESSNLLQPAWRPFGAIETHIFQMKVQDSAKPASTVLDRNLALAKMYTQSSTLLVWDEVATPTTPGAGTTLLLWREGEGEPLLIDCSTSYPSTEYLQASSSSCTYETLRVVQSMGSDR